MSGEAIMEQLPLNAEVGELREEDQQPTHSGDSWHRRSFVAAVILVTVGCAFAGGLKMSGASRGSPAATELQSTVELSGSAQSFRGPDESQCCPGGVFSLSACCSDVPTGTAVSSTSDSGFCKGTVACNGTVVDPTSDLVCSGCAAPSVDTCCKHGTIHPDYCCDGVPPGPNTQVFAPTGCQGTVTCYGAFAIASNDFMCQCPAGQTTPAPPPAVAQPSCFPGEAAVYVAGRGVSRMDSLGPNAAVLVQRGAGIAYEPVLDFLHIMRSDDGGLYDVVVVSHATGQLKVTPSHLVFVIIDGVHMSKMAKDLKVGDKLIAAGPGSAGIKPSVVLSLAATQSSSVFAPLTSSGRIVVGGAVVSVYASPSADKHLPHSAAHAAFFVVRAAHALGLRRMLPPWANARPSNMPREEMHPFARWMLRGLQLDKILA